MKHIRAWVATLVMLGIAVFWPNHAQSGQKFQAELKFNPMAGTSWHYFTAVILIGDEIRREHRDQVGGVIWSIHDERIDSSGGGLVGVTVNYNVYESLDLGVASEYENPGGGPMAPPEYSDPGIGGQRSVGRSEPRIAPDYFGFGGTPLGETPAGGGEPLQSIGGGGGGAAGGGGGGTQGGGDLMGEGEFEITPILETTINYIMSESGRMLDLSGLELIGEIIDPSRSITVRQVFQTSHFLVLPDYEVHLNEQWRAPMSWTIPFVGETMEIPLTYRLADIRTTFRFHVAAIDFSGVLQFDVDVADEGEMPDDSGRMRSVRKESNIKGDIIIQGRAYLDLNRGVVVAVCDTTGLGNQYFINSERRGNEPYYNDIGLPWPLNPGFFAQLNFERRDLYTPLGNVIDPRQEVVYRIQELQWFTTAVVE